MDKKSSFLKLVEPNSQLYSLLVDVLMFSKHKLTNGVSTEGVEDILRKAKVCVVKILNLPESKKLVCRLADYEC